MLRSSFYSIVPLILTWTSAALADFEGKILTNNIGCDISGLTLSKGFSANFYSYSYEDTSDYTNSNFYLNGAYSQSLITTAKFIDPNFVYSQDPTTTATAEYWGVNLPITNFAADFYGYFYAEYTGIYSFEMVNVDEAAMVWVGAGGLDCCNPSVEQLGSADTAIMLATKDWQSTSSNQESWVYLEAGYYYPIKIVYVNVVSNGALDFQVTDPEGHTENIMNNVYQLQGSIKGGDCSSVWASATSSWETYTYFDTNMVPGSTVSSPASSTNSKGEVVTYIDATVGVGSFVSTTETSYWTKTEVGYSTTTVAQYYDGTTNAVEIVYVLRPVLSTSVSTWSNGWINYSTYSDATTTYVVEYLPPMNTKYTEWGSDSYSTTTVTTSIEWQGNTTYVQIYGPTLSTSYVFPEGQQGTNTYTKTMTYSDGSTSDIVVVQLPQAPTTYIPWTSTGTTTYTSTWSESGKAPSEQVIIRGPSRTTVYVTDSTNYITTATGVVTTNSAGETVTMDIIYDHQNIQTVVSFGTQFTKLTTFTSTGINADWQTGTYVYIEGPIPTNIVTTQAPVYNVQTSYFWSATASGTAPTTGSWNAVVYVPYYQTTYVQWDKSYETEIVSYTNLGWTTTAYNVKYVPSYSVSYSYWDKTYESTVTIESSIKEGFSYKPTTYVYIQAPQPRIVTSTWEETYSTTITTYATFSSDGSLFTSSEIIVQVPGTKVVKPWTIIVVSNYECDGTGIATSVVETTIDGISTDVEIEYQTVLANTCYPDSSTSSSESSNSISSSSSTSYESSGSITASSSTYSVSSDSSYVLSTSSSKSSDSGFALPTSTLINTRTCGTVTYTTTVTEELVATGVISSGKVTGTSTYVLVVEEIPDTSCFKPLLSSSVSSLTTYLSVSSATSKPSSVVSTSTSTFTSTPASSDYAVFTTTETAFDCHFTSYTTNIGTTDSTGRYMNATLVIFETPASTCLDIPTFTTVLPAPDCKETTFTSFTSTLNEFSSSVSAVLVVVKTKPASCEVSAPTYVLSTTVVTATDCEATTVTLYSTTFGSDGQTTIFDNVVITKAADTCTENQQSSTTQESSSSDISAASQVTSTATVESYVTSTIYCTRCHHTIYTTVGTTVTDGITVTTTECVEKTPIYEITSTVQTSADNHSLPLTTYTTVVDNITKTVTEPCSDSNTVPTSSALGDSDETSGSLSSLRPTTTSLITVTTDATPNINFTTYTTVSNDVTITVTKPCSETNSPESLSSETSEVAPESVVTPMSYTTDAVSETLSASTPGVTGATPTNGLITYTTVLDDTTITVTRPCSKSNSDKTGSSASETQSALYSSASSATVLEVNNISSSVSVNPAASVFTTQPGYSLPASMMTISNSSSTYPAAEPTVSIYNGGAGKLYPGLGSVAVILAVALL